MKDGIRIMVVDDESIVGERLKRLLEKEGYNVENFIEGSTAIHELGEKNFDIIITDLKMEGVDGIKILEAAKKKNPDIKVIIITGFGKKETAEEAFEKGAFDFVIKPFKLEELKQVIKKAEAELTKK